jgi:hypothetical protein
VFHNPSYMLLAAIILMFCVIVASSSGADIAFNVNLGVTSFTQYQASYGIADNWYWSSYNGYPCMVYVYYEPWGNHYVWVMDGIVVNAE